MTAQKTSQSFIPKSPIARDKKVRGVPGIFFVLSLIIFLVTAGIAGGLYAYQSFLERKIENMSIQLERAKAAFDPSLIVELKRLNQRIEVANNILDRHISFSEFFTLLEGLTLENVRFTTFNYSLQEGNTVDVTMNGEARSFSSVALQSDVFGEEKYVLNPVFNNLNLDESGNVGFDFRATIDESLVLYKENL